MMSNDVTYEQVTMVKLCATYAPATSLLKFYETSVGNCKAQIVGKTRVRNALMHYPCLQEFANSFELLESRVSDRTVHAVAPTRSSMGLFLTKRRLLLTYA